MSAYLLYNKIFYLMLVGSVFTGCNGAASHISDTTPTMYQNEVATLLITTPPIMLNVDTSFYKKYINAAGIPVMSSVLVPDEALYKAQKTILQLVSYRPDVLAKLIENKMRVTILAKSEVTTDIPEYRELNTLFQGSDWNENRGIGATISIPVSSGAEENILCYGADSDVYANEDILIHELAHGIHALGISFVEPGFDEELEKILAQAIKTGLWENTYAATNAHEYFAEGVQSWFNINAESIPSNGIHNHVNTRKELEQYDPLLFALIARFFRADSITNSCHQKTD